MGQGRTGKDISRTGHRHRQHSRKYENILGMDRKTNTHACFWWLNPLVKNQATHTQRFAFISRASVFGILMHFSPSGRPGVGDQDGIGVGGIHIDGDGDHIDGDGDQEFGDGDQDGIGVGGIVIDGDGGQVGIGVGGIVIDGDGDHIDGDGDPMFGDGDHVSGEGDPEDGDGDMSPLLKALV